MVMIIDREMSIICRFIGMFLIISVCRIFGLILNSVMFLWFNYSMWCLLCMYSSRLSSDMVWVISVVYVVLVMFSVGNGLMLKISSGLKLMFSIIDSSRKWNGVCELLMLCSVELRKVNVYSVGMVRKMMCR